MIHRISPFLLYTIFFILQANAIIQSPPRITKQPPTDEVLFQVAKENYENDKPFLIECEAEAEPAPKYRWIKNGKHFDWQAYDTRMSQQTGRGTLVITVPRDEDLGQYQCFAENEWGIATSNSVFVRKAELNAFKESNPVSVTAVEGEPFSLKCSPPDGWPKPNVYWLLQNPEGNILSINNSRMTLDPEGNLWFSNVTRYDSSQNNVYVCSASSVFRNEYKLGNKVLLNVAQTSVSPSQNKHEPVKQYVTRRKEIALRGQKSELYCIFGGTPLPQIVWSKGGRVLQSSDRITQGHYGKSLIIKHVNFDDQGTYTCEASNGVGQAKTYSIELDVLSIPYFTEEPDFVTAAEDETVEFRCAASGVPEPQIKWIHNGKPIAEAPPNPRRKVSGNSIIIDRLMKNDTGNYGCNATNSLGYVYKDVYVNVLALAPEITEPPIDEATVDGRTVTLKCRVFGSPKPLVKWEKNGQELTGGRYTVQENGDLVIKDVIHSDAGEYKCYASNKFGGVDASGTLQVKDHTTITDEPEDYEVVAGTQATFRCNAVADQSLSLEIDWLNNGQPIDFEIEARFVKTSDYSLTITRTIELDSGIYTCVAKTELDEATAQATLIVQDVPNAPKMLGVTCMKKDATISWTPMGDNRAPILRYIIQHNTSFTPDTWESQHESVPAIDKTFNVAMSPWANYTFRIIAVNKVGMSLPSSHSSVCTTQPEVPHKNPDNVEGRGTDPHNMVIYWTPMPEIEHNAPRFQYRVSWKLEGTPDYTSVDIFDWQQNSYTVQDVPTYKPYRIKVIAINERGEANVAAKEVIGYSGEDMPERAPTNFTLEKLVAPTNALVSWNPVPEESVKGELKGYIIETWTDNDGPKNHKETHLKGNANKALLTKLVPHSKNYARVYVYNGRYKGPPSEILSFVTPEGVPGPVRSLDAYPMGSSAFYLVWKKPQQPNGVIIGYNIYYRTVNKTEVGPSFPRVPQIMDPEQTKAKLSGLQPNVKYRLLVLAVTAAGEGENYFIERTTTGTGRDDEGILDIPQFVWRRVSTDENGLVTIRVDWLPNIVGGRPGSQFYVRYKLKGAANFERTDSEVNKEHTEVRGLYSGQTYEIQVIAEDGDRWSESEIEEIDTYGDGPIIQATDNVATAGWFIGMMLAIAILILILILVCLIKRNRGGKYSVYEREHANGRHDYPEDGGFHEYSHPLDSKSQGRTSMNSDQKAEPGSDSDSAGEYGEGGMNEDGSFIGQYGRQRKQGETTSQGFATLV